MKNEKLTRMERLHAQRRKDRGRRALKASAVGALSLSVLTAGISPALAAEALHSVDGNGNIIEDTTLLMPSPYAFSQKPDSLTQKEYDDALTTAKAQISQGKVVSMSMSDADKKRLESIGYTIDLDKSLKLSNENNEVENQDGVTTQLDLTGSTDHKKVEQVARDLLGDDADLERGTLETLADQKTGISPSNIAPKSMYEGIDQIKAGTRPQFDGVTPTAFIDNYSQDYIDMAAEDDGEPKEWWISADPSVGFTNEVANKPNYWIGTAVYDVYTNSTSSTRTDYLKANSKAGRGVPANTVSCYNSDECGAWVVPTMQALIPDAYGGKHDEKIALTSPVWISVKATYSNGEAPEVGKEHAKKTSNGGLLWFTPYDPVYETFWSTNYTNRYWTAEKLTPSTLAEEREQQFKLWNTPSLVITDILDDGPQVLVTNGGSVGSTVTRLNDDGEYSIQGGAGPVLVKTGEYAGGTLKTAELADGVTTFTSAYTGTKYTLDVSSQSNGKMVVQIRNKKTGQPVNGPSYNVGAVMNVLWNLDGRAAATGFGYSVHYQAPDEPVKTTTPPASTPTPEPSETPTPTPTAPEKTPTPTPEPSKPEKPTPPTPTVPKPSDPVKLVDPVPTPSKTATPVITPTPEKVKKEQKKESVKKTDKSDTTSAVEKPKSGAINAGANKGVVASIAVAGILFMAAVFSSLGYLILNSRSRREESETE